MSSVYNDLKIKTEIQNRLKAAVNYNQWLWDSFESFVGRRVLEVGCSIGNFTEKLVERCDGVLALDVIPEYAESVRQQFGSRPGFEAFCLNVCDRKFLEVIQGRPVDTVLCQNVLEHIEDDRLALRHMRQSLTPGGHLILLVPAFKAIYGTMDKADDHFRRYDKSMARTRLEEIGFKIKRMHYMNMPGFFGWFFNGRILKREVLPANQLATFDKIVPLVAGLEKLIRPPFGQSLLVIAER